VAPCKLFTFLWICNVRYVNSFYIHVFFSPHEGSTTASNEEDHVEARHSSEHGIPCQMATSMVIGAGVELWKAHPWISALKDLLACLWNEKISMKWMQDEHFCFVQNIFCIDSFVPSSSSSMCHDW
jgi:hypothetical protein